MRIRWLEPRGIRNLQYGRVELTARTTVLVGENGQGKTNFLEAIYFAIALKPLRTVRLRDLVQLGLPNGSVAANVVVQGVERQLDVELTTSGSRCTRAAVVDGKPLRDLVTWFDGVAVVAFTPDDLALVKGGPEGRRRALDRATFNRFPVHLSETRDYLRALKNRNRLLRETSRSARAEREAFEVPLCDLGARIVRRRLALLEELGPRVASAFDEVGRAGALSLDYRPAASTADELLALLNARAAQDEQRGFTSVGPHADDWVFELDGRAARSFASQGQQRAIVLALKVGEIENLRDVRGVDPLLLLDDVSSELDPERNAYLMSVLARLSSQAVLTTTDARLVAGAGDSSVYFMRSGKLSAA